MAILLEKHNLQILQEAYYGKPKEFVEIEKRLEKIIEMIRLTKEEPSMAVDINSMKELEEIEDLFTKFFKNYKTSITFYSPILSPAYNAFTFPSSLSYFRKDPNNKRIARSEDLFINVNVDIGLVYALEMTPQELMAIILHEIGHCFDASFFMLLSNICINATVWFDSPDKISKVTFDLFGSLYNTFIRFLMGSVPIMSEFYQVFNRLVSSNPMINKIISDVQMVFASISSFVSVFNRPKPYRYLFALLNPSNVFGYANEKFADSFATSYGYGKDVASSMYKMQQRKGLFLNDAVAKIPILNVGHDLLSVSARVSTLILDPHPHEAARIQSQLTKLKRDLNDPNLDYKVKKELLDNIRDLEDIIDNVILNADADENKGRWISMFANYIVIKVFNGKIDPRELFEAVWNHEM